MWPQFPSSFVNHTCVNPECFAQAQEPSLRHARFSVKSDSSFSTLESVVCVRCSGASAARLLATVSEQGTGVYLPCLPLSNPSTPIRLYFPILLCYFKQQRPLPHFLAWTNQEYTYRAIDRAVICWRISIIVNSSKICPCTTRCLGTTNIWLTAPGAGALTTLTSTPFALRQPSAPPRLRTLSKHGHWTFVNGHTVLTNHLLPLKDVPHAHHEK
jgi:hypothetical protein